MHPPDESQKKAFLDYIQFIRPLILSLESIKREPFQLRSLSIPMRWEVTRRHPFYQKLWKYSADFYQKKTTSTNPFEQLKRESAVELLALIGISGEPPDPSTPFSKLGESELNKAWLSGAVHPITLRGMAGILLATLPESTLGDLGQYLIEASGEKNDKEKHSRDKSLSKLASYKCKALDSYPAEPLVSVNPAASQRQISEAIKNLHGQWKNERELDEQRDRSDKVNKYLEIWDLREGFLNDGTYDVSQERTFKEIAKELSSPLTTVNNHYRSAFKLIIGKDYSPELWWNTMGVFKLIEFNFEHSVVSQLRPRKSRSPRPVPESILGAEIEFLNQFSQTNEFPLTYDELMVELKSFIKQGLSDEEIHLNFELEAEVPELKEALIWLRSRTNETEK